MTLWRLGVVAASKSAAAVIQRGYFFTGTSGLTKILYASDTTSVISFSAPWSGNQPGRAAFNSSSNGYYAGGTSDPSIISTVSKLSFVNETESTLGTGLSEASFQSVGLQSTTDGYVVAGGSASPPTDTSRVDKYAFASDSRSTLATGMPQTCRYQGGFSSTTHGYACGGGTGGGGTGAFTSGSTKFAFSDDSRSTGPNILANRTFCPSGFSSSTTGYLAGGNNAGALSSIVKVVFSTDTASNLGSNLAAGKDIPGGNQGNSTTHGYVAGGRVSNIAVSSIEKLSFSAETVSSSPSSLAEVAVYVTATNVR